MCRRYRIDRSINCLEVFLLLIAFSSVNAFIITLLILFNTVSAKNNRILSFADFSRKSFDARLSASSSHISW